jgi:nucleoside-diphosphate-sugar epimerase
MVVVAVAGGTGNVGRAIVEAILAAGKHEVKILGRKVVAQQFRLDMSLTDMQPNPALESELGVPIIPVDYSDVAAAAKVLEENNIHTIVSTMSMFPMDGSKPHEPELIQAADLSKTTVRMISSDWGVPHKDE